MNRPNRRECKCHPHVRCNCEGWNESWEVWNKWDLSQWDWNNKHYAKKLSHREESGDF